MTQPTDGLAFSFSVVDDQLMLHWHPEYIQVPLTRDELLAAMTQAGYTEVSLDHKALDFFLLSQQRLGSQRRQICVGRFQKPEVHVHISQDGMKAWLTVTQVPHQPPPSLAVIQALLHEKQVVYGILPEVLLQYQAQGYLDRDLIAQGQLPLPGKSAWFEYLVPSLPERASENERIDFRQRSLIQTVCAEQPLMRKHPAQKGRPGKTVTGQVLPAEDGRDYMLHASQGSVLSDKDPHLLMASREGRPVVLTRSVRVDNLLILEDVNYGTGHIDFKGSVLVQGTVSDGFQVKATGDIIVRGSVEDAVLEADHDIRVYGSMFGRERARLSAGGNIFVTYVQSTDIDCLGDLQVHDGLFYCQVRVLGEIRAGLPEGKGRINGGEIWSGKRIVARVIGSHSSTTTRISLGGEPYLRQRLRDTEHQLRFYKSELEPVLKAMISMRTRVTESKTSLSELEARRNELLEKISHLDDQLQDLRAHLNRSRYYGELVVYESVMRGTRLRLAEKSRSIDQDLPACRFYLHPDAQGLQIRMDDL